MKQGQMLADLAMKKLHFLLRCSGPLLSLLGLSLSLQLVVTRTIFFRFDPILSSASKVTAHGLCLLFLFEMTSSSVMDVISQLLLKASYYSIEDSSTACKKCKETYLSSKHFSKVSSNSAPEKLLVS
jgi:hypothetical protein